MCDILFIFTVVSEHGKAGKCPYLPIRSSVTCDGKSCSEDKDCPGAQQCCSDDRCGTAQCRDPVSRIPSELWDCVYEVMVVWVCVCVGGGGLGGEGVGGEGG